MVKELITMDMPIESVYHDYKLVADSITDDESFQKADTGILLSNLYDVVKALEKQIPKKPKKIIPYDMDIGFEVIHTQRGFCSSCGQSVIEEKHNFCPMCGRQLNLEYKRVR